jgi:CRISPR-associated protein Cmr5
MRTRDQRRAEAAFKRVEARRDSSQAEYKRFVKRFPALILNAGLAQAVAFAQGKGNEVVLDDIASVIEQGAAGSDYALEVRTCGVERYQWLTRETLCAAGWIKRYAEALLSDPLEDEEAEGAQGAP